MTYLTPSRDALAKALAAHRIVYEQDGDFGEKTWVACSCSHLSFGDDYWTGDTEEDHERHVAENLPVVDAGALADNEDLISALESRASWRGEGDYGSMDALEALAAALNDAAPARPNPYCNFDMGEGDTCLLPTGHEGAHS